MVETEGVSDGDRLLTDLEMKITRDFHRLQSFGRGFNLENGDVFPGLNADDLCIIHLLILEGDGEGAAVPEPIGHDVVVRDDVPFLVPHKSRSGASGDFFRIPVVVDNHTGFLGHEDSRICRISEDRNRILFVFNARTGGEWSDRAVVHRRLFQLLGSILDGDGPLGGACRRFAGGKRNERGRGEKQRGGEGGTDSALVHWEFRKKRPDRDRALGVFGERDPS